MWIKKGHFKEQELDLELEKKRLDFRQYRLESEEEKQRSQLSKEISDLEVSQQNRKLSKDVELSKQKIELLDRYYTRLEEQKDEENERLSAIIKRLTDKLPEIRENSITQNIK